MLLDNKATILVALLNLLWKVIFFSWNKSCVMGLFVTLRYTNYPAYLIVHIYTNIGQNRCFTIASSLAASTFLTQQSPKIQLSQLYVTAINLFLVPILHAAYTCLAWEYVYSCTIAYIQSIVEFSPDVGGAYILHLYTVDFPCVHANLKIVHF